MDKRFRPLTPPEQLEKRKAISQSISDNPDWPIDKVITFIRMELQLTQPEMAKVCKVSKQTIFKIEQGGANPTIDTIEKILRPFGFQTSVSLISTKELRQAKQHTTNK